MSPEVNNQSLVNYPYDNWMIKTPICVCACVRSCTRAACMYGGPPPPYACIRSHSAAMSRLTENLYRRPIKRLTAKEKMHLETWVGCEEQSKAFWVGEASPPTQRMKTQSKHQLTPHSRPLWSLLLSLLFSHTCKHCAASVCCAFHPFSPLQEQRHCVFFQQMKVVSNKIMLLYNLS